MTLSSNAFVANHEGYRQYYFSLPREDIAPFVAAWDEVGALAVSVEEAQAFFSQAHMGIHPLPAAVSKAIFAEPDGQGNSPEPLTNESLWECSIVSVLLDDRAPIEGYYLQVLARGVADRAQFLGNETLTAQDWLLQARSSFQPVILKKIAVLAHWHAPLADRLMIHIDPGQAFGSGAHPTTYMMLDWIESHSLQGLSVCDYGCGSGILAIAMSLLGAQSYATDIDPIALQVAQDNAHKHGLTPEQCCVLPPSLAYERIIRAPVNKLFANILLSPLLALAPTFHALIAPQGNLLMSGILADQVDALKQTYAPHQGWRGFEVIQQIDDWVLVSVVRENI